MIEYEYQENESSTNKNFEENIRRGFIRKVYLIILTQLAITFGFCLIPMYNVKFRNFQRQNVWLMIFAIIIYFTTAFALFCYYKVAKRVPINYIILFIFTFALSYMVSFTCASVKDKNLVGYAALMTLGVTLGLTVYAFITKSDFTFCGSFLCVCTTILLFCSFGFMIFGKPGKTIYLIFLIVGVIVYSIFLIYDTQLIAGGKSYQLDVDDYILGACMIYLDIIILFTKILEILSILSGD